MLSAQPKCGYCISIDQGVPLRDVSQSQFVPLSHWPAMHQRHMNLYFTARHIQGGTLVVHLMSAPLRCMRVAPGPGSSCSPPSPLPASHPYLSPLPPTWLTGIARGWYRLFWLSVSPSEWLPRSILQRLVHHVPHPNGANADSR